MRPVSRLSPELAQLARRQEGVLTRSQLCGHGFSRKEIPRRLDEGSWSALCDGIYLTSAADPTWMQRAWAGVLLGGEGALVTARGAAWLYGIERRAPDVIPIAIPHHRRIIDRPGWIMLRTRHLPEGRGTPPRMPVARTVLDLIATNPDTMVHWLTTAVNSRLITAGALASSAQAYPNLPHRGEVLEVLNDVHAGTMSALELRYLRRVERAHHLPTARRQLRGRYLCDVDYGPIIVELDGRLGHVGTGAFRDRTRDNHHQLQGRPTLRYGWQDCFHAPCDVAMQVATLLTQHGWRGVLHPCPRCPPELGNI